MRYIVIVIFLILSEFSLCQTPFLALPKSKVMDFQLAKGLKYQILFSEGDSVINRLGKIGFAKGDHDYNCLISNTNSSEAKLFVSHECNDTSTILGDGGGATILDLKLDNTGWKVLRKNNVDFSEVGGTITNCSGLITSNNKIISAEEFPPSSNVQLYKKGKGFRDTSDFNTLKRWQNMGWMVEIEPKENKATQKLYSLGRFSHEAGLVLPDKKTMFLTDDHSPSVFFKFVAEEENNFNKGQLYAYRQSDDGSNGSWIALPMQMDSLLNAREVALKLGATIFLRMEWMTMVGNKIYISETGTANFNWDKSTCFNGRLAKHLQELSIKNGTSSIIDFPHGAVLEFLPHENKIRPLLKGGKGVKQPEKFFFNPDGISYCKINQKSYLVINEDNILKIKPESNKELKQQYQNKIWWLDLSISQPKVDDLKLFMVTPEGAESTGGYFTPDYKYYFVNIQHPSGKNTPPWNKSCTLVISGW